MRQACGQLLVVGFEGQDAPEDLLAHLRAGTRGALCCLAPTSTPRPRWRGWSRVFARRFARHRGWICPTSWPLTKKAAASKVASAPDRLAAHGRVRGERPALAEQVGRALGSELAALGIGWNFAPVLDVATNPDNPVIGDRALGRTPEGVAALGLALARGMASAGVLACGKHFPGHGDTAEDSHLALPVVGHDMARLQAIELMPFRAAAAADLPSMMTAHVVFKAIDDTRPATLAPDVIQGLLRDEMGYRGLIVSDDLAMAAVAERAGPGEVAVEAIAAGCDVVLMRRPPAAQDEIFEALVRRAEADGGFRDRVFESAGRFAAFKSRCTVPMPLPTAMLPSVLGTAGHRALASAFGAPKTNIDATGAEQAAGDPTGGE